MQKIMGQIRAAIEHYEMISPGDRIAIGVSGGKDSLVLLHAMAQLQNFYPIPFELVALTVDPCFSGKKTNYTEIEKVCEKLKIPYIIRRTTLGKIIFEDRKEKNPCSLCARMRRGILHNMAKENNCNKIALGHHFDDAVQTFFMNLFYGGSIGCFSPKSYLSRKQLTLIRPMIFCHQRDISSAARRNSLPIIQSGCPVDGITCRKNTEELILSLESTFPDLRNKVIGAIQRAGLNGW